MKSLSRVWLLATPWTAALQAPPSMGFSRQKYRSFPTILSEIAILHPVRCALFAFLFKIFTVVTTTCHYILCLFACMLPSPNSVLMETLEPLLLQKVKAVRSICWYTIKYTCNFLLLSLWNALVCYPKLGSFNVITYYFQRNQNNKWKI